MNYTIQNLKEAVAAEMGGESTDDLSNFNDTVHRAGLAMLSEVDPPDLERVEQIAPAVFDDIDVYTCPDGYRYPVDIVPSGGRLIGTESMEDFRRTGSREFGLRRHMERPMISDFWDKGTRLLLLRKYPHLGRTVQIDTMDATTGWSVSGDGTGLGTNLLNKRQGSASLEFDTTFATNHVYLSKTSLPAVDLTDFVDGAVFMNLFIPTDAAATQLADSSSGAYTELRIGNDVTTNYWGVVITSTHDGRPFHRGWNIIRFDLNTRTVFGAPTITAFDSIQLHLVLGSTNAASYTGFLVDDITLQLGTMYDLTFGSSYLFRTTSTGVWKEKPENDTDSINLSGESLNLFIGFVTFFAMRTARVDDKDLSRIASTLGWPYKGDRPVGGELLAYQRTHPSQRQTQTSTVYDFGI